MPKFLLRSTRRGHSRRRIEDQRGVRPASEGPAQVGEKVKQDVIVVEGDHFVAGVTQVTPALARQLCDVAVHERLQRRLNMGGLVVRKQVVEHGVVATAGDLLEANSAQKIGAGISAHVLVYGVNKLRYVRQIYEEIKTRT